MSRNAANGIFLAVLRIHYTYAHTGISNRTFVFNFNSQHLFRRRVCVCVFQDCVL